MRFPANLLIQPTQSFSIFLTIKMRYSIASIASLVALGECLSLPPLIPSIPGVTELLYDIVPPLPILQVPTPAKESPPFSPSDIKPKKIGYFWTGAGDKAHKGKDLQIARRQDDANIDWQTSLPPTVWMM
jgi:hypothetical protein